MRGIVSYSFMKSRTGEVKTALSKLKNVHDSKSSKKNIETTTRLDSMRLGKIQSDESSSIKVGATSTESYSGSGSDSATRSAKEKRSAQVMTSRITQKIPSPSFNDAGNRFSGESEEEKNVLLQSPSQNGISPGAKGDQASSQSKEGKSPKTRMPKSARTPADFLINSAASLKQNPVFDGEESRSSPYKPVKSDRERENEERKALRGENLYKLKKHSPKKLSEMPVFGTGIKLEKSGSGITATQKKIKRDPLASVPDALRNKIARNFAINEPYYANVSMSPKQRALSDEDFLTKEIEHHSPSSPVLMSPKKFSLLLDDIKARAQHIKPDEDSELEPF